jgi:hypothetical protein
MSESLPHKVFDVAKERIARRERDFNDATSHVTMEFFWSSNTALGLLAQKTMNVIA